MRKQSLINMKCLFNDFVRSIPYIVPILLFTTIFALGQSSIEEDINWTWTDKDGNENRKAQEYYEIVKNPSTWIWLDRDRIAHSSAELEDKLKTHYKTHWTDFINHGTPLFPLDLSDTKLQYANLQEINPLTDTPQTKGFIAGINFEKADLRHSFIYNVDVRYTTFNHVDLSHTNFIPRQIEGLKLFRTHFLNLDFIQKSRFRIEEFDLNGIDLSYANLANQNISNTTLSDVILKEAILTDANLSYCNLESANLEKAILIGTNFSNTILRNANLTYTVYEPQTNPTPLDIAFASGLDQLKYKTDPAKMIQLSKEFYEDGYYEQSNKITAAYRKRKNIDLNVFYQFINRILFEKTCNYGAEPFKPLELTFLFFWPIFLILYLLTIKVENLVSSIYGKHLYLFLRRYITDRKSNFLKSIGLFVIKTPKIFLSNSSIIIISNKRKHQIHFPDIILTKKVGPCIWMIASIKTLAIIVFFSLLCVFNLGFRDFDFGRWLRLLLPFDVDFKSRGLIRIIAGFQSIISVYLIALFFLTYFGRPFEGW